MNELVRVPTYDNPKVSVLLLAYRRPSIPEAVRALVASTQSTPYEVRILLNGASGEVEKAVSERIAGALVDRSPENLGFAAGVNRLAAQCSTEFLALLNDDTAVEPQWLDALVRAAEQEPEAALISSRLIFPDGRLQEAGARLSIDALGVQIGWGTGADESESLLVRREIDYGSAAAVLVRRELFEQVGGFDEAFFPAYYEDVDLALRLKAAGGRVLFEPSAVVVHDQWGSTNAAERSAAYEYTRTLFLKRWGFLFDLTGPHPRADLPDTLLKVPAAPASPVPPCATEKSWQRYAQWLVGYTGVLQGRLADSFAEQSRLHTEIEHVGQRLEDLSQEHHRTKQVLADTSVQLEAQRARAVRFEAAYNAMARTTMWRVRRRLSKTLRSNARIAHLIEGRRTSR